MPSQHPRKPEIEVKKDENSGFIANIYDGEHLIQVRPHENGYQLSLASKNGLGDKGYLRTSDRQERYRSILEHEYGAIDADDIFAVLDEHFDDEEYRIVKLKPGIKHFRGRGVHVYVETGTTVPTLVDERDYRDDRWETDTTYRVTVWPDSDQWTEIRDPDSGDLIADYRPKSLLEDIQNEEKDDHERERGPTSVPGVHAPVGDNVSLENGPVVHTRSSCQHLRQLQETEFNPAGEDPPRLPAGDLGKLLLRWCSACQRTFPTPDELREKYGPD